MVQVYHTVRGISYTSISTSDKIGKRRQKRLARTSGRGVRGIIQSGTSLKLERIGLGILNGRCALHDVDLYLLSLHLPCTVQPSVMNAMRPLQHLGQVLRRTSIQAAPLRTFASSTPSLSSIIPPRGWTPTPFVTETVVSPAIFFRMFKDCV